MKYRIPLFVGVISCIFSLPSHSQGCSDAGFCTMGAMKPDQPYNKKIALRLHSIEMNFYRATTTLTPIIYVATADLNFSLNSKNSFQVKLPYQAVTGRLANTSSIGDISLCYTRNIYTSDRFDLNFSLGGKIPTNHSDKVSDEGFPLPMYYQTSLGSYDFITGLSLINRKWLFATGIQIPLTKNGNQFLWESWANSDVDQTYLHEYNQSKELKRGTDIMFRVERNFRLSRFHVGIGVLPIYRINNDEIADAAGNPVKPDGAHGLALSALANGGYSFNTRSGIKVIIGHNIIQRERNPDGLTRHFISTITYYYRIKG